MECSNYGPPHGDGKRPVARRVAIASEVPIVATARGTQHVVAANGPHRGGGPHGFNGFVSNVQD